MKTTPSYMTAAVLTGFGGLEKLEIRHDVPVPKIASTDVLIEVGGCGINNTDINTRAGWYNRSVKVGTTIEGGTRGFALAEEEHSGGGEGAFEFPRIQGADVSGIISKVGTKISPERLGERVLVDPLIRELKPKESSYQGQYLGNGIDGGFAQFCKVPAVNAITLNSSLTTEELATLPCSYSTAELMLTRSKLSHTDTVVITGASGGVGSAAVQLAKKRGSFVIALTTKKKMKAMEALNPDVVLDRNLPDLLTAVRKVSPRGEVDVVVDVVGGVNFSVWIDCLRRKGRYVTSGAIGGPIVELDLRSLYLKDLLLVGATELPMKVFSDLIRYIENGEIKPLLAQTFALEDIHEAQRVFMNKEHIGNLVVVPPRSS